MKLKEADTTKTNGLTSVFVMFFFLFFFHKYREIRYTGIQLYRCNPSNIAPNLFSEVSRQLGIIFVAKKRCSAPLLCNSENYIIFSSSLILFRAGGGGDSPPPLPVPARSIFFKIFDFSYKKTSLKYP